MDSNEDMENINNKEEDEDFGLLSGQAKKIKRAKNFIKTDKIFYFKLAFILLIIEAYYSYNYGSEREFASNTRILGNELNITTFSEPFYWYSLNV